MAVASSIQTAKFILLKPPAALGCSWIWAPTYPPLWLWRASNTTKTHQEISLKLNLHLLICAEIEKNEDFFTSPFQRRTLIAMKFSGCFPADNSRTKYPPESDSRFASKTAEWVTSRRMLVSSQGTPSCPFTERSSPPSLVGEDTEGAGAPRHLGWALCCCGLWRAASASHCWAGSTAHLLHYSAPDHLLSKHRGQSTSTSRKEHLAPRHLFAQKLELSQKAQNSSSPRSHGSAGRRRWQMRRRRGRPGERCSGRQPATQEREVTKIKLHTVKCIQ